MSILLIAALGLSVNITFYKFTHVYVIYDLHIHGLALMFTIVETQHGYLINELPNTGIFIVNIVFR